MDVENLVRPELTEKILAAAFVVHSRLGPGLLESAYRECLVHQLLTEEMDVQKEVPIPLTYDELTLDKVFRADLIVNHSVLLELKSVDRILPIHETQTLTYLRISNLPIALLLNFNTRRLKDGIRRFVLSQSNR